ncbi:MAG: flagellar hook assembly protein FlgD [Pseudomonadota bacterium]|nr:flagellar hook assembly protein FlgD [Pseudomonadota bacterium]
MTSPISPISTPSTTTGAASTSQAAGAVTNALSYNDFITLLMTELRHQDPTQPMDPTAMVSQLATVSQVGQSVLTNQKLTSMLTTSALTQAEMMIGQTVTSTDGQTSGVVGSVTVSSSGTTATLTNGATIPLGTGATVQ